MSRRYDCADADQRERGLVDAANTVGAAELVVFPTDTVYGVAADAFSPTAVRRLLAAKGRGRDVPVPVLVAGWRTVHGLVEALPETANDLIAAFWPGSLTLVLPAAAGLAWDLGETRGTVAVRMPLHPLALELLGTTGPLAVSSANRHGSPAPTSAGTAEEQLGDQIAVYLDGGPTPDAVPSSIVDLTGEKPRLLRLGAVSREALADVLGGNLVD